MLITIIGETMSGQAPTQDDLNEWVDTFDADYPVLADPEWELLMTLVEGTSIGLPSMTLLGPGSTVVMADTWVGEDEVVDNLP